MRLPSGLNWRDLRLGVRLKVLRIGESGTDGKQDGPGNDKWLEHVHTSCELERADGES